MGLEGKVAFVTGSTRGIGWATAQRLAHLGATVVLNGRSNDEVVQSRVNELEKAYPHGHIGICCDMADPTRIASAYQRIFREKRGLDILVNNAGIMEDNLVGMISHDMMHRLLSVNTEGVIHNLQAAARLMARKKSGSIVNLTSIVGVEGNAGQVAYSASKAAVIGITKSAAKELAPQGIRVNAVAPGLIATDMSRQLSAEKFADIAKSIKIGRIGTPEDVANVIAFLSSDDASYVTGQVIGVDGGMTI